MHQKFDLLPINPTKLSWPPVPDDFVPRRRLQPQLDRIEHRPLTVISAPAGYGKTTSISAWLSTRDAYCAWLSLDERDDSLPEFLRYFVAAIRKAVPTFDLDPLLIEKNNSLSILKFLAAFDTELDRLDGDLILVLDDFHLIRDANILALFTAMMRHPHPALHLVLALRHDPALPLADWRARNQVVDIRASDLRFGLDETAEFLKKASGVQLDNADVAFLQDNTEGWAVALRLVTLTMGHGEEFQRNAFDHGAADQDIMDYLSGQVLDGISPETRSFLLQTSILDRMTAALCDAVVSEDGAMGSQAMLEELLRENMFLVTISDDRRWFRYHNLFQEFLRGRLTQRTAPEDVAQMHLRASHWFKDNGDVVEAIKHALAAGEADTAVALVAKYRQRLMLEDRWHYLESWYRLFPEQITSTSPDLMLIRAWTDHFRQFDISNIRQHTDRIDRMIKRSELDPVHAQQLSAEVDVLRGLVDIFEINPAAALKACRHSLEVLPTNHYIVRSYAWLYVAVALQMQGDLPGANESIQEARREDLAYPNYPMARASATAAFVSWMAGDLVGLRNAGEAMMATASIQRQPQSHVWGHYFVAAAGYHQNHLEEALVHAQFAFDHRFSFHAHGALNSGLIVALIHSTLGHHDKANETMAEIAAYAVAMRSEPLMALAQAMRAELAVHQGRVNEATHWAGRAYQQLRPLVMAWFYAPQLTVLKALLAAYDPAKSAMIRDYLNRLREQGETAHNTYCLIEVLALEAMYHDLKGNEQAALSALVQSLSLAEASDYVRIYTDLGHRMRELIARLPLLNHTISAEYLDRVRASFHIAIVPAGNEAMVEALTERECQVLELLAKRLSNKEIALELYIAEATVKRHTVNIYQKLGVKSRRDAVQTAYFLGLLS